MSKEGERGEEWSVRENTNWKQKLEWENAILESNLLNSVFKVVPRSCPNYSQIIRLCLIPDPSTVRLGQGDVYNVFGVVTFCFVAQQESSTLDINCLQVFFSLPNLHGNFKVNIFTLQYGSFFFFFLTPTNRYNYSNTNENHYTQPVILIS